MTGKRRVWSSVLDGVGCAVVLQLLAGLVQLLANRRRRKHAK